MLEQQHLEKELLPLFTTLTRDDQDSVRIVAVDKCAALVRRCRRLCIVHAHALRVPSVCIRHWCVWSALVKIVGWVMCGELKGHPDVSGNV